VKNDEDAEDFYFIIGFKLGVERKSV